jgi:uncharacterized protein (TIGR02996 family)
MPILPALLDAIREEPNDERRWIALASWLWDNGRDDEAAVVRMFWPTLRDNVTISGVSLLQTLRQMTRHQRLLGRRAKEIEERAAIPITDADWD